MRVPRLAAVTHGNRELAYRFGIDHALYSHRLFIHHYEEFMERAGFEDAREQVASLGAEYRAAEDAQTENGVRLRPRGLSLAGL